MFALAPGVVITEFDVAPSGSYLLQTTRGRFMLSRSAVEMIRALEGKASVADVARSPEEVMSLARFLEEHLVPTGVFDAAAAGEPERRLGRPQTSYVYASRELVKARTLQRGTDVFKHLFRPGPAALLVTASLLAQAVFWLRNWGLRLEHIPAEAYATGTLLFMATMPFHELGHGSACRHYGSTHGSMGFAMYLIFPCFYTDVTDAWRLPRWRRVVIDLGGIYFHLIAAGVFALIALRTGQAAWAAALVFINWCIVHSLKPYLRGDGYWVLMDIVGLPSPYRRVREYVAWRLARALGRTAEAPLLQGVSARLRGFALGYVVVTTVLATWLIASLAWKTCTLVLPAYPAVLAQCLALPFGSWPWWRSAVAAAAQGVLIACLGMAVWSWSRLAARGLRSAA